VALRTAIALRYDAENARRTLTQILIDRGDVDGALALSEVSERLDPGDVALRLRRADLLAANGRGEEAEREYAAAARICPEDAEAAERRGHARLRDGKDKEALKHFQRALDLRPQNPQLKEPVRAAEPDRER